MIGTVNQRSRQQEVWRGKGDVTEGDSQLTSYYYWLTTRKEKVEDKFGHKMLTFSSISSLCLQILNSIGGPGWACQTQVWMAQQLVDFSIMDKYAYIHKLSCNQSLF